MFIKFFTFSTITQFFTTVNTYDSVFIMQYAKRRGRPTWRLDILNMNLNMVFNSYKEHCKHHCHFTTHCHFKNYEVAVEVAVTKRNASLTFLTNPYLPLPLCHFTSHSPLYISVFINIKNVYINININNVNYTYENYFLRNLINEVAEWQ